MRGLRKYLTPFAPDQSGAESVFYELGGIVVILDAGGCAGNICGFDEPRWSEKRSAVFSAGLRDMDAVMGRDRLLVKKICDCVSKVEARFVAIIGTPVPAVIGTDLRAVSRMLEKEIDLPVIPVSTDGMHLYDRGVQMAYRALFRELERRGMLTGSSCTDSTPAGPSPRRRAGVFGVTPLDLPDRTCAAVIREALRQEGYDEVILYGSGAGLEDYMHAGQNAVNIAASADGMEAVSYLKSKFGTPSQVRFPGAEHFLTERHPGEADGEGLYSGKVLIVQSQVLGNSLREEILHRDPGAEVTVADWFFMSQELMQPQDVSLKEEDDFTDLVKSYEPGLIIGDRVLMRMIPEYTGKFIHLPQFSISGKRDAGV